MYVSISDYRLQAQELIMSLTVYYGAIKAPFSSHQSLHENYGLVFYMIFYSYISNFMNKCSLFLEPKNLFSPKIIVNTTLHVFKSTLEIFTLSCL